MNCWEDPQFIADLSKIETIILTDKKFDYLDIDEFLKQKGDPPKDRQKSQENDRNNKSSPKVNK